MRVTDHFLQLLTAQPHIIHHASIALIVSSTATSRASCVPHPSTFLLTNASPGSRGMQEEGGMTRRFFYRLAAATKGEAEELGMKAWRGKKNGQEVCERPCFCLCSSPSKPLWTGNKLVSPSWVLAMRVTGKCSTFIYPNHEPFQCFPFFSFPFPIFSVLFRRGSESGWVGSAHHKGPIWKFQDQRGVSSWQVSLSYCTIQVKFWVHHTWLSPACPIQHTGMLRGGEKGISTCMSGRNIFAALAGPGEGGRDSQQTLPVVV